MIFFRKFWITWLDGQVKVGRGSFVGKNVLVSWNDPNFHEVRGIAVSTGFGNKGRWLFSKEQGKLIFRVLKNFLKIRTCYAFFVYD